LEDQKQYFDNLIQPISSEIKRIDIIENQIDLNSTDNKNDISRLQS